MHQVDEDGIDEFILVNASLYEDTGERARHVNTVKSLAKDIEEPIEEVAHTYESLLQQYKQEAQIQDYLPVLIAKRVKELYRTQHPSM